LEIENVATAKAFFAQKKEREREREGQKGTWTY
jgi:hypothetical protein